MIFGYQDFYGKHFVTFFDFRSGGERSYTPAIGSYPKFFHFRQILKNKYCVDMLVNGMRPLLIPGVNFHRMM